MTDEAFASLEETLQLQAQCLILLFQLIVLVITLLQELAALGPLLPPPVQEINFLI